MDVDRPVEDPAGAPAQDPLVKLLAYTARLLMIDVGVVIHVLAPVGQEQTVQRAGRVFGIQRNADVVAHQGAAE